MIIFTLLKASCLISKLFQIPIQMRVIQSSKTVWEPELLFKRLLVIHNTHMLKRWNFAYFIKRSLCFWKRLVFMSYRRLNSHGFCNNLNIFHTLKPLLLFQLLWLCTMNELIWTMKVAFSHLKFLFLKKFQLL